MTCVFVFVLCVCVCRLHTSLSSLSNSNLLTFAFISCTGPRTLFRTGANGQRTPHRCRHLVLDKQCPICKTPIDIMAPWPAEVTMQVSFEKDWDLESLIQA